MARRPLKPAFLLALTLALFFLYCELLKTYRSSQWGGSDFRAAAGLALGGAFYCGLFFALILAVGEFLRRISGKRIPPEFQTALGGLIAGGTVWAVLSQYREFTPTLDDAVVAAGLAGLCGALALTRWMKRIAPAQCAALMIVVLASGITALAAAGYYFLFDENRAQAVTAYPAGWMVSMGILGLVLWAASQRKRPVAKAIFACAVIGLPPLLTAALTYAPARDPSDQRPNLLLVISDALRADTLGAYGGPAPTPNLDAMAQNAAVFDRCYSLAPWTMPSMSSMFASAYPPGLTPNIPGDQWLSQIWMYRVPEGHATLAAELKKQGYATGSMAANALLWVMPGILQGFDTIAKAHPVLLTQEGLLNHLPFLEAALAAHFPVLDGTRPQDTTARMTRYAAAWLRRHRNQPFFLWVHYMDPHAPCDPPARFRSLEGPWPFLFPYKGGERWNIPILGPDFAIRPEDQPYVRSLYEGEARYADEQFGVLCNRLDALGVRDNTIVCFTSDHGEELWEHGDWGHGHTVYNELLHVPLLVAGKGIQPRRIPETVSAIDLMPTLAELLGLPQPPEWKGSSLAEVLRGGQAPAARPIFAQGTSNRCWPHPQQAVIDSGWKLVREAGSEVRHLYNLNDDPAERNDLAAQYPDRAAQLGQLLTDWLATFPSEFNAESPSSDAGTRQEMMENLHGMGYL